MECLIRCRRRMHVVAFTACCIGGCTDSVAPPKRGTEPQSPSGVEQIVPARNADASARRNPVARVLGKEIYEDDLIPRMNGDDERLKPADEQLRKYRKERLLSLIWQPLMDEYCRNHQLHVTKEE